MNFQQLPTVGPGATILIALLSIAFGLLNCFFGYRLFRFMLGLYGLLLGAVIGFTIANNVTDGQVLWLIVGAIAGGLVGTVLMVLLYFVGVFVVGAVGGAMLANAIGALIGIEMPTLVVIILALVVGVIALFLQRVVLILATAFTGSWTAISGIVSLLSGRTLSLTQVYGRAVAGEQGAMPPVLLLLLWLILGVAGAVVQFRMTRDEPARPIRPVRTRTDV